MTHHTADLNVGINAAGMRLHAARLGAGFLLAADAAWVLGVSSQTYRRAEQGLGAIPNGIVCELPFFFGVSAEFLDGQVITERERLADQLASLLTRVYGLEAAEQPNWSHRLKQIRVQSGLSQAEAAHAMGWLGRHYANFEDGDELASLDRQIGFALALGGSPAYAVLGERPALASKRSAAPWWRPLRGLDLGFSELPQEEDEWGWLNELEPCGVDELVIPVVEFSGDRYRRLPGPPLRVPRYALPASAAVSGWKLFGLMLRGADVSEIVVVDPQSGAGDSLFLSSSGGATIGKHNDPFLPSADPMTLWCSTEVPEAVGRVVMRIQMR